MVVEDRFGTNSKLKKKILGSIENYDYHCMLLYTAVRREKERVAEKKKKRWSLCGQRIVSRT